MKGRLWLKSAVVLFGIANGAPAHAAGGSDVFFTHERPLSGEELSEQRGGFSWNGLDIRFGAELRSYAGDHLVLRTIVNWDETAGEIQRIAGAPAAGLNLGASAANAVLVNQGQTAFIQRTVGAIQNIIVNTASNVDLRQQVDARLDIGGYAPFRDGLLAARINSAFSGMRVAAIGGRAN